MQLIRVLLADDHPVVLAGIRALLEGEPNIEIVAEVNDGAAALRQALEVEPDVALLDLSMPKMSGAMVAQQLSELGATCRVLILTVQEDRAYLRQLLDTGIAGYVLKRSVADELARAIRSISAGGTYFDPAIVDQLIVGRPNGTSPAGNIGGFSAELSEREAEVLRLTASGHSNKVIATRLDIGVKTVETYKSRAMSKLGLRTRPEIIRFALDRGWLTER